MRKNVSVVSISDLHLFNPLNPTSFMVNHATEWLTTHEAKLKKADVFVIAGDWFHRGVSYSSPLTYMSLDLITTIGLFCLTNGLVIRILEGTKSHDMNQNEQLVRHLNTAFPRLDVKLFKTISIEHINHLEMDVLYVPDDCGSAAHVWDVVREKMVEAGISKVDMGIMHGCFEYQIPMIQLPTSHSAELYLSIVRYLITIGHHHVYNPHESMRILPQGSLDRTAHGQEGPKGGILMHMSTEVPPYHEFLENKLATIFIKYRLTDNILKDETNIRKLATSTNEIIHIRLVGTRDQPLMSAIRDFSNTYEKAVFTVEWLCGVNDNDATKEVRSKISVKAVNKDNFPDVLADYLKDSGEDDSDNIIKTLKGFLDEYSD